MASISFVAMLLFRGGHVTDLPNVLKWTGLKLRSQTEFDFASYNCSHRYTVELLSIDPLVMYINGFLKNEEVDYLLDLTYGSLFSTRAIHHQKTLTCFYRHRKDDFGPSVVYNKDLQSVLDRRYRTSQSAMVSRRDVVGECLAQRMKSLLGNFQREETEPIQVVKYEGGERFRVHMDWFDKPMNKTYNPDRPYRNYNRLGSIFAYLDDNCTGGETYFPELIGVSAAADGDKFSRAEDGRGLLIKPRRGNAVFWNNLLANGSGNPMVAHASLPIKSGRKVGINLFSYYFFDSAMVGDERNDDSEPLD